MNDIFKKSRPTEEEFASWDELHKWAHMTRVIEDMYIHAILRKDEYQFLNSMMACGFVCKNLGRETNYA